MPVEIRVPQLGESVVEATITRWLKHEGDPVAAGDVLAELETDKVNVEVVAEQPGVLERIARHEGETVAVDEVIALVAEKATATPTAQATSSAVTGETAPPAAQPAAQGNGRPTPAASPVAARLAADKGIDLSQVPGSGPGGKVLKEDVENFQGRGVQAPAPPQTPPPPPAARAERPAATPAPLPALTPPSELREE